jgi:acylphosphatase
MNRVALLVLMVVSLGVAGVRSADPEPPPKKKKEDYKGKPAARHVFYTGRVQGVGFRATAEEIARDYPVTGWVKNLNDGRVELLAEGPGDAVEDFLKAIRGRWKKNIEKQQIEERPVSDKYKKFAVTR